MCFTSKKSGPFIHLIYQRSVRGICKVDTLVTCYRIRQWQASLFLKTALLALTQGLCKCLKFATGNYFYIRSTQHRSGSLNLHALIVSPTTAVKQVLVSLMSGISGAKKLKVLTHLKSFASIVSKRNLEVLD